MDGEGMIQDVNMRICRQKERPRLFFWRRHVTVGGKTTPEIK